MTQNTLPKISVVTVSFNQGEFIEKNIQSVLAQDYPNFEHIIVDGGSTDNTLDILRKYPHLKWTSARDDGQSDALNKGFGRASGDIIAWLNSDDWYAEGAFHAVAKALEDYPVVLGQAAETDRDGNVIKIVENPPRTFYDLARYWIPFAWVAQTSVFFRRSVLEEVKRVDDTYLDQDLFFVMDLDLWFRIALKSPFIRHIPQVLSYFRIYDTNKTGARPKATQRECSRVYRRYMNGLNPTERQLSYIMPMKESSEICKASMKSFIQQTNIDFDIFIVDYAADKAMSKGVHEFALDLSEAIPQITVRYAKSSHPSEFAAFSTGVQKAVAPIVGFLQPGDTLDPDATHLALRQFAVDTVGLILPHVEGTLVPVSTFFKEKGEINLQGFLTAPYFYPNVYARRLALLELETFRHPECPSHSLKELLLRLIYKGWSIQSGEKIAVYPTTRSYTPEVSQWQTEQNNIILAILKTLKREFENDPFGLTRAQVRDPRALIEALKQVTGPL
jgi:cellulose synthase/poly-beta-1,6-N-acetylglucosamine synthase-like glycosyltransferase